jgi:hypothetical protein
LEAVFSEKTLALKEKEETEQKLQAMFSEKMLALKEKEETDQRMKALLTLMEKHGIDPGEILK